MSECLAEAFYILRGVLKHMKICMSLQLDDASIGFSPFNFIFGRKNQPIVFMLRVFIGHFSPVQFSKTIFCKRAKPLAYKKEDFPECELYKMPLERA